jgi:hypothetical protein
MSKSKEKDWKDMDSKEREAENAEYKRQMAEENFNQMSRHSKQKMPKPKKQSKIVDRSKLSENERNGIYIQKLRESEFNRYNV